MKKFYIQTLGCKVNQYESDGIAQGLENQGWTKGEKKQGADVFIINTCAVTSKASMQSRQAIRKIIRENPEAKVIVTGCHAQTNPEQIKKIDQVDQIVCHKDKTCIANQIDLICSNKDALAFKKIDHNKIHRFSGFDYTVKGEMTRAYLKIQDGCDAFCTYCIVPYARGSSVSMPQNDVFQHLKDLNASGFKEVILTGIHTGLYGLDFKKKTSLLELLEKINRQRPVYRARLSSIEPGEINDGIIRLARPQNVLCDHFHIPLQSGDNDILKKMKRPYDAGFFEDRIHKIKETLPLAGIGVDTLIGFPSETDKQFENTYELIEKLPISYLHVFPFSARKGTPAYHFDHKVDPAIIKQRCTKMRELDKTKRQAFIRDNLNHKLEGLVQHKPDTKTGRFKAVTSNYLTLFLNEKRDLRGKILDLIPEQCDSNMTVIGKIID
ncbi:MAG: tRNA (N(6)-L-threonylcarbamoyladenosine(37)-C(2))-methylthiotransferase MtaB [Proteobacteria bacterium]|nr:tRNA (N(6)-L-threonylcarbamoyladenosine(37)-C(2))-methylthiotransferase MtaB [Pseudomonadota bacterium]MBU1582755.1 tRNA (N(6)-L-threonylcarbamoyladenosine(37)-C(2))-methylthiotransferase MtaB [Pseudomonadota bacterium]MBU2454042.1 tRNA (N(6)-L-threonylcarbamoyladenosine(37)-C(2))-methylthiotransferase MtaB [Pseudomonadota bacterium]MBU2631037.1 tRNA (N(6)-L-threonylcarbamoyladenosine(37)-C(2))-methylthiotransferase MtaB [Pseudomonadota bacterium]